MSGAKMEREERSKKVEEIADKLVTGEISTQEAAEELMKMMRIMPDEKPAERKRELEKSIKRLKESRETEDAEILRKEFMDNAMEIMCDMSDEEFEKQRQEYQPSTFAGLNKNATLNWMQKVIEGGYVPWDIKVEILLQIGIRTLLNLKEKPKQQKNAFSLIVNCLAVTLPEAAADEVLAQSIEGHKELRENTELTICGDITVKNILDGEIL